MKITTVLSSFILLALGATTANAAEISSLELCRKLGAKIPSSVAYECGQLIRADEIAKKKESLKLAAIAKLAQEQGARSAFLASHWRKLKMKGNLNLDKLACHFQVSPYGDDKQLFIVCTQPIGKGMHVAGCSYDNCSEEYGDMYFSFIVDENGVPNEQGWPQAGQDWFNLCRGLVSCPG